MLTAAELEALLLSLKISSVAVLCALPFAVGAAALLARPSFRGKLVLDGLVHLPLVLPPVVMGYLLLIALGTRAPLGGWLLETFGIRFMFSWTGAALAAAIVTFPFQVRAIRLALEAIDPGLSAAAETLGAGPVDRFFTIVLPLALPGIVAGAITAFAASLGEFGAIITFVSNVPGETRTLPLAIYTAIQTPGGEAAAARLVVISILLALAGLMLSEILARRVRRLTHR
ncbi:molybdate ABC transporter permease subunit [Marinimicrococcus flavescens]|uniref:Molybdenum transport system permease n=1 Tax=Marinimicrococcus flavescens TaxID=3031815 RepID=A0AAP3XRN8_9PROT|nr:molybdate ABC transporter permease subunit [Marinimicrococcus flavescens]